ncbi:General transcription factor IIH subunit 5 [Monocercomonoides exilis]|uniref:General transcription factor IIH subunit 5 n=1 Tax=Monocercomonoides exilis TaxID=2049356 RepID=UPI0035599F97|nr:General transcription factor IIH subunit 5 [Monocercomonoides exilis]|eukprot:MONOS_9079.1-p1 / transcript=MONOS_9079.1 / gene=MONOS_9079 / organism=Monocercomonoides_exilis_PA203 / gene_product=General transcription factor IIH subunit 5 / transcript_product=General transcription factor IIH subunit 5 / location=Mono_scaffold00363:33716-34061(+) / protein_length=71 / sequence_SO=supercontig / SO=protein_coding / is_pseudo=false
MTLNITEGVFFECDPTIKELILKYEKESDEPPFIITVLDDSHLLIRPGAEAIIQQFIDKFHDSCAFSKPK